MSQINKWRQTTIGAIAKLATGSTPPSKIERYYGGKINWYTPQDLQNNLYLYESHKKITEDARNERKARFFPVNTILVTGIGNIGRLGIIKTESSANQQITGISLLTDDINVEYLFFWLLYNRKEFLKRISKATLPIINQSQMNEIPVLYPNISEQRRIVARIKACMERVEEIRNLHFETTSEKKALLSSFLSERFSQLLKKSKMTTINEVAIEIKYGTSQKCSAQRRGMAILRIPNVAGGNINLNNLKYCELNESESEKLRLKKNDLLFIRTNGSKDLVGRCAIFDQDEANYGFASYLIRLRVNQNVILPQYLSFFLESIFGRKAIDKRRRTSAGQFNINSESLKSIEFPNPELKIQKELINDIYNYRRKIITISNEATDIFNYIESLSKSILQKAFSGEL